MPRRNGAPAQFERRGGITLLGRHVALRRVGHRQPRADAGRREPAPGLAVPRHRRALGVAALVVGPEARAHGVEHVLALYGAVDEPDLVALVQEGRAAQGEEQQQRQLDLGRVSGSPAGGQARDVVVGRRPDGPGSLGQQRFGLLDHRAQRGGFERRLNEHEVEPAVQFVVAVAVELRQGGQLLHVGLADEQPLGFVGVRNGPPAPQDVVGLGAVRVVDGTLAHELLVERVVLGGRRVVAQLLVLNHHVAHVNAEPGHAAVPPEAHNVVELAAHVLVPPVEVRLRRLEVVQVVLAAGLVEVPGRPAENAGPVVRQPAVGLGVGPDVVVAMRRVTSAQRVDEPGVLVAGVVGHQVHEDADVARCRLAHQLVQVLEGAEGGIDVAIVRDVVAPVAVGRAGDR